MPVPTRLPVSASAPRPCAPPPCDRLRGCVIARMPLHAEVLGTPRHRRSANCRSIPTVWITPTVGRHMTAICTLSPETPTSPQSQHGQDPSGQPHSSGDSPVAVSATNRPTMPDISPTPSPGVPVPLTRTGACGWDRNPSASGSLQCPSSSPPLHEVETVVTPGAQDAPQGDLPVGFHSLASPGAPQALGFQPYPPWVPPLGGYPAWYGAPPSAPICGYSAPLQPYASIAPLPPLSAYPGYYP